MKNLTREAKVLSMLQHPSIVRLYETIRVSRARERERERAFQGAHSRIRSRLFALIERVGSLIELIITETSTSTTASIAR